MPSCSWEAGTDAVVFYVHQLDNVSKSLCVSLIYLMGGLAALLGTFVNTVSKACELSGQTKTQRSRGSINVSDSYRRLCVIHTEDCA